MNKIVEVKLWGTTIGYLGYAPRQNEIATFEYSDHFYQSGIQISPILMTSNRKIHTFQSISQKSFKGVAGIFADSLPDKFGNQLIDLFMAQKQISSDEITTLDRLLYVGNRAMGALEYHPAEIFDKIDSNNTALNIKELSELASMVSSNKKTLVNKISATENFKQALKLIKIGSSAGGARSKAVVAKSANGIFFDGSEIYDNNYSYWILKFDSDNNSDRDSTDPKGMPKIEYIYSLIAKECGINIPETDYIIDGNNFHFLIERFDRIKVKKKDKSIRTEKLHYASWAGLTHSDRDSTGTYSYEQLILCARQLGLGQDSVLELYRRAVFNIVGRNQDDHTKNFGFLMNKNAEWSLSPAFDMTFAYDPTGRWTRVHQIMLNGKQDLFKIEDLVEFGKYCNLNERKSREIVARTVEAFMKFDEYASEYGLSDELREFVLGSLRTEIS